LRDDDIDAFWSEFAERYYDTREPDITPEETPGLGQSTI